MLGALPDQHQSRLARGRTFAKSGRVRGLWFIPGTARAEVFDTQVHDARIHLRTLERPEWDVVINVLLENLGYIAALIEGDLPTELVDELEGRGLQLVPTHDEITVDCDCADYLMPCAHVSAVHHVLADALDGDPFLLLTLRGRAQDQILNTLRESWGDHEPLRSVATVAEEAPPDGDWFHPTDALVDMKFSFTVGAAPAMGLRALGPPPGHADLERTLAPLYAAGAKAAVTIAHVDSSVSGRRRRRPDLVTRPATPAPEPAPTVCFTQVVVDALVALESASSKQLSKRVKADILDVRSELLELEKLGLVYRTGQTRGTRWWLG